MLTVIILVVPTGYDGMTNPTATSGEGRDELKLTIAVLCSLCVPLSPTTRPEVCVPHIDPADDPQDAA